MYYVPTFTVYQFKHSFTLFCSYQAPHFDWRLLLMILDSFTCDYNCTTSQSKLHFPTYQGGAKFVGIVSIKIHPFQNSCLILSF